MSQIRLLPPIKDFTWSGSVSQLFGVNYELYNKRFNLLGHQGLDIVVKDGVNMGYGTPILASHDGQVSEVSWDMSRLRGMGVKIQASLPNGDVLETTYWHLSSIKVYKGQAIKAGEVIGGMGNTGFVFPEKTATCPNCGTHLHFAVSMYRRGVPLFSDYPGGFQDPVPFLFTPGDKLPLIFTKDLFLGRRDNEVSHLQTCLNLEGLAKDYTPIGYFGLKTKRDVSLMQSQNGINPTLGYLGPKTRAYLNKKYSAYA